jgi:hypothetical protein
MKTPQNHNGSELFIGTFLSQHILTSVGVTRISKTENWRLMQL